MGGILTIQAVGKTIRKYKVYNLDNIRSVNTYETFTQGTFSNSIILGAIISRIMVYSIKKSPKRQ